jgi:hypothetical protein
MTDHAFTAKVLVGPVAVPMPAAILKAPLGDSDYQTIFTDIVNTLNTKAISSFNRVKRNDYVVREFLVSALNVYLKKLSLFSYKIVCDDSNNKLTSADFIRVDLYIKPTHNSLLVKVSNDPNSR